MATQTNELSYPQVMIREHTAGAVITPPAGRQIAVFALNGCMEGAGTITASFDGTPIASLNGAAFGLVGADVAGRRTHAFHWHDPDPPDHREYVTHIFRSASYFAGHMSRTALDDGQERAVVNHDVEGDWIHRIGTAGAAWATGGVDEPFEITASSPFFGCVRYRLI